ncbi:MAG: protein GlmU [Proteobacteria bacterium]|nr:protein GlmU [Pseudomonadota bacterium]
MKKNMVKTLIEKGVNIPNPESVFICDTVNPDCISSDNVTIYSGCKVLGSKTLIMKNSSIGYEAPVTLENTLIGENTQLHGGFFRQAVFAGDNVFGSGAHVREGTILEEQANAAHTVGLKQTILFPFVTLGSLINFCDCFMAGGTSRKNHSEVGSSFIHFNYTPNQDKATPSMMGDVHHGVMLNSKPIFLGGQGGIVGPIRINYGCLSAAGSILRKDELRCDRLLMGGAYKNISFAHQPSIYTSINHIYNNNIYYISGLIALKSWYRHIRSIFITDHFSALLQKGMQENLDICIKERIKRLDELGEKLKISKHLITSKGEQSSSEIIENHDVAILNIKSAVDIFKNQFEQAGVNQEGKIFIQRVEKLAKNEHQKKKDYISVIQNLSEEEKEMGSLWLYNIEHTLVKQLIIKQE